MVHQLFINERNLQRLKTAAESLSLSHYGIQTFSGTSETTSLLLAKALKVETAVIYRANQALKQQGLNAARHVTGKDVLLCSSYAAHRTNDRFITVPVDGDEATTIRVAGCCLYGPMAVGLICLTLAEYSQVAAQVANDLMQMTGLTLECGVIKGA